jgi:peptidoglycan/LPS O-acetylase OafA/YrhL
MKPPSRPVEQQTCQSDRRFEELDGLRGLASVTVFFSHLYLMQGVDMVPEFISRSVLRALWDGTAAVFLFFVLSGFVLALPYFTATPRPIQLLSYLIRRFFRIYPAYVFALLLSILLMHYVFVKGGMEGLSQWIDSFWNADATSTDFIKHLSLIKPDTDKIDPPVWTLRLELFISSVFPLIVFVLQDRDPKFLRFGIVGVLVPFFLAKPGFFFYVSMFIAGGLVAKHHLVINNSIRRGPSLVGPVILVISLLLYSCRFTLPINAKGEVLLHDILVSGGAVLLIISAISYDRFNAVLKTKPVQFLGNISYSFYLLHFPLLLTVSSLIYPKSHSLLLCGFLSLTATVALSYLVVISVEKPFQAIGKRFSRCQFVIDLQQMLGSKLVGRSLR